MGDGGGLVEVTPQEKQKGEGRQQYCEDDFGSFLHGKQRYNSFLDRGMVIYGRGVRGVGVEWTRKIMCKNFKEGLTIRELMLFLQSFCESDHKLAFLNLKATIAQLVEQLTCNQ